VDQSPPSPLSTDGMPMVVGLLRSPAWPWGGWGLSAVGVERWVFLHAAISSSSAVTRWSRERTTPISSISRSVGAPAAAKTDASAAAVVLCDGRGGGDVDVDGGGGGESAFARED